MTPSTRLAIVLSHPVQYYSPWFRWLRAQTSVCFKVFYLWKFGVVETRDPQFAAAFKWDVDLLSGYDHEFVPNRSAQPGTETFGGLDNPELCDRLAEWQPGAILLFGYNWKSHQRAIWWARWHGIPLLFRGDSHLLGRPQPGWRQRLTLATLYRQFAAVTYVGAANRAYFRAFDVPHDRLFFSPHAVDAARFEANAPLARIAAASLRTALGLDGKRIVLFAGKLLPAKQPRELLAAFLTVATNGDALLFVGDGPEKDALKAEASARPDRCVRFLPFANQTEMPARYLLADLFVLPSRGHYETWGLAVNEAMHLGVPCLVSDRVGCQLDLVEDGRTGWVFAAEDPTALVATLQRALQSPPETRHQLGRQAAERVGNYTYAQTSAGLLAALAALPVH